MLRSRYAPLFMDYSRYSHENTDVFLQTVTFYWTISDFLLGQSKSMSITAAMEGGSTDAALVKLAYDTAHPGSGAALWMLLLLRLTAVTTDHRLELRNSAVQTLLRIIHAYGNSLDAEAWALCIRAVIFKLLSSTEGRLQATMDKSPSATTSTEWDETAVVIIGGVSELLSNYLEVLVPHAVFPSLWRDLLGHFATMLDFKALDISTAVFSSLGSILAKDDEETRWSFDQEAIGLAWGLWARGVPVAKPDKDAAQTEDNQKCLVSWVDAFLEIERLMRADMTLETIQQLIRLLRNAMVWASAGSYANDIEYMTPLQNHILEVFKIVRTDIDGVPSAVIFLLADFVSMAFEQPASLSSTPPKRTFVAMSKSSMPILHYHVTQNTGDAGIFSSGAFSAALKALAKPVVLKYRFRITTKSLPPWKEAVNATLAILEIALPHLKAKTVPAKAFQEAWNAVVSVSNGIISADLHEAGAVDDNVLSTDQQFDISAFQRLRELIIPSLGSATVSEKTRRAYAEGLFRISIVHAPAATETALFFGANKKAGEGFAESNLNQLYKPGRGRTIDPPPTKRTDMSYVCLDELFSLVKVHPEAENKPSIVVQPPTPRIPPPMTLPPKATAKSKKADLAAAALASAESERALHVRLAQTAAQYLILRCALSLRAYVADQPLRGHMPQPLSQRRELSRVLRYLVDLRSEPGAIPDLAGVKSEGRKHLLRLYPLLVQTARVAGTAGDDKTLALVVEALDAVGTELGVGGL